LEYLGRRLLATTRGEGAKSFLREKMINNIKMLTYFSGPNSSTVDEVITGHVAPNKRGRYK
jgi:hypothetical protein